MKQIQITGVIRTPKDQSPDQFYANFMTWIESNGYLYTGKVVELNKNGKEIHEIKPLFNDTGANSLL